MSLFFCSSFLLSLRHQQENLKSIPAPDMQIHQLPFFWGELTVKRLSSQLALHHDWSPIRQFSKRTWRWTRTWLVRTSLSVCLQTTIDKSFSCPFAIEPACILNCFLVFFFFFLGISEMYKTPIVRKRKSVVTGSNTGKTPVDLQSASVVEPSVLNTPEETGTVSLKNFTSLVC